MNTLQLILFSKPVRQIVKKTMKIAVPVTLAGSVAVLYHEGKKISEKEAANQ